MGSGLRAPGRSAAATNLLRPTLPSAGVGLTQSVGQRRLQSSYQFSSGEVAVFLDPWGSQDTVPSRVLTTFRKAKRKYLSWCGLLSLCLVTSV